MLSMLTGLAWRPSATPCESRATPEAPVEQSAPACEEVNKCTDIQAGVFDGTGTLVPVYPTQSGGLAIQVVTLDYFFLVEDSRNIAWAWVEINC